MFFRYLHHRHLKKIQKCLKVNIEVLCDSTTLNCFIISQFLVQQSSFMYISNLRVVISRQYIQKRTANMNVLSLRAEVK